MQGYIVEVALGILSAIIIGLLTYTARAMSNLTNRTTAVEVSSVNNEKWLAKISHDVHQITRHDTDIAILNDNMKNVKNDIAIIETKVTEFERREIERSAHSLHRR